MSITFELDPARPDTWNEGLDAAADALEAGRLVVFPTETVYGIACRPDLPDATERLFAAKHRPGTLNLPILAGSTDEAWLVGIRSDEAQRLADRYWPGPLTLVLRRTERSRDWRLGERTNSIGVRVPDHAIASGLLARTGPLAVTSANLSGEGPLGDRPSLEAIFGATASVLLVLPAGPPLPGGLSSTVVDLTRSLEIGKVATLLLREGPITSEDVGEVLGPVVRMAPFPPESAPGPTR